MRSNAHEAKGYGYGQPGDERAEERGAALRWRVQRDRRRMAKVHGAGKVWPGTKNTVTNHTHVLSCFLRRMHTHMRKESFMQRAFFFRSGRERSSESVVVIVMLAIRSPLGPRAHIVKRLFSNSFTTGSSASTRRYFNINACRDELRAEYLRVSMESSISESYEMPHAPWYWLDKEMSSNVAGETGAVCIYDGAAKALEVRSKWLGVQVEDATLQFIDEHRAAEAEHLRLFLELIPPAKHTQLLPIWRIAGFSLGFLPALVSDRALFVTVEAVESFVEEHYGEQIAPLLVHGRCPELVSLLQYCCADEVHHKEDAALRASNAAGASRVDARSFAERIWMRVVHVGSAVAAEAARRM